MLEGLLHGYAIIERTGELSGGRVRLSTWTLYIALDDLSAEGDVEPVRETIDGWGRRSYGLTPHRACELLAQANRMAAVVSLVTGGPPTDGGRRYLEGALRVTGLERHCRWLLRAYPAWYRRERSDEMLGALLEASPPGRSWPTFRDTRTLIVGNLRVPRLGLVVVDGVGGSGSHLRRFLLFSHHQTIF